MRDGSEAPYYRFIFDPVFVVSFLVMVTNDLVLRKTGIAPAFFGKLSDAAILIFLPAIGALLICFMGYIALGGSSECGEKTCCQLSRPKILISVVFTGTVFTLIKTSGPVNDLYISFINSVNILYPLFPRLGSTEDPTDLITLPALAVSYWILRKHLPS